MYIFIYIYVGSALLPDPGEPFSLLGMNVPAIDAGEPDVTGGESTLLSSLSKLMLISTRKKDITWSW